MISLYIVGAPRSGTHLIKFCLEKSGNVYVAPELGLLYKLLGGRYLIKSLYKNNPVYIWNLLLSNEYDGSISYLRINQNKLIEYTDSTDNYVENIFLALARLSKKQIIADKTPNNIYFIDSLETNLNEKVIIIKREWKNTVSSIIKSNHMSSNFYNALAKLILSRYYGNQLLKKRNAILVDYFELTSHPREILNYICDFLSIRFEEEMLMPGAIDSSYEKEVIKSDPRIGIVPEDIDKWMGVLTKQQEILVDFCQKRQKTMLYIALRYPRLTIAILQELILIYRTKLGLIGFRSFKKYM